MKKHVWLTIVLALILTIGSAATVQAAVLPPHGEGQIGRQAVVLCEELTVRQGSTTAAPVVTKVGYGSLIIVDRQADGWAHCYLGDSEDSASGWVNADYIVIDPAWYRTDAKTPVYAWNATSALKVALLDKGETLPILKQDGDWLLISLRGAVGWIHKSAAD